MNSPSARLSPSYRNLRLNKLKHSPIELKEKMRKDYKDKIQNCRNMLLNKLRGTDGDTNLREELTQIYKSMFNFSNEFTVDDEEQKVFEEIKDELVQEEFEWWNQEYEKSTMENFDWSVIEQENNVICPICQLHNCSLDNSYFSCINCNYKIPTTLELAELKNLIDGSIEKHDKVCSSVVQFNIVSEFNESHIYLFCDHCHDMQLLI